MYYYFSLSKGKGGDVTEVNIYVIFDRAQDTS